MFDPTHDRYKRHRHRPKGSAAPAAHVSSFPSLLATPRQLSQRQRMQCTCSQQVIAQPSVQQ